MTGTIVDHRTRDTRPISEIGFWAVATDRFLSGWGQAASRSLVAYPLTGLGYKQQEDILAMMDKRQEFQRVRTNLHLPRLGAGDHLSIYDAPDLS